MENIKQAGQIFRIIRSVLIIVTLSVLSIHLLQGKFSPPHGNPVIFAFAISWLIAISVAVWTSLIFYKLNPKLFCLARWEQEGEIYNRFGVKTFRWILLHTPLGWINPSIRLMKGRSDIDRLQRDINAAEWVHWITCIFTVILATLYFIKHQIVYGYCMILINIPFNLYPIMVQRWIKGRVCRMLRRFDTIA